VLGSIRGGGDLMTAAVLVGRGQAWFTALAGQPAAMQGGPATVLCADAILGKERTRFLAVVADPANRFPRARHGEVGLEEAWTLALKVREAIEADTDGIPRPIVAIVDVSSQAYGRREEMLGIHLACAAAADAYATARLIGHPVVALLVGKAMSGAFLAHGYQASRILALDSPHVLIHAMSKQSAARVTRRSIEELERLGESIPPMAYGVRAFASLGLIDRLIGNIKEDRPVVGEVERVQGALIEAIADIHREGSGLQRRLENQAARDTRAASIDVRRRLAEQWHEN
jgi:malonate decarboxylase gamma subunit